MIRKLFIKIKLLCIRKKLGSCGENVIISYPFDFSKPQNIIIGNNVYIGPHSWISSYGEVIIGNGSIIGPRIKIYTGNHNYNSEEAIPYDGLTIVKSTLISENVWIGGDVILLPGVIIGEGSVVGAGSVVTKDVAPGTIVGGNPAKVIKLRDMECYNKLKSENKIYLRLKKSGLINQHFKNG